MSLLLNRRSFLKQATAAAGSMAWVSCSTVPKGRRLSANDKLNIGIVGVANQGNFNLTNVATENIAALCDIDDNYLAAAGERFPQAKRYNDFRRLLEQPDLDAVVVATPDHVHAVASKWALESGRHVYCEKPLARTISEVRAVTETARRYKRVTQIGTQIHAGSNYRRVVELVQSGAIGAVREVHVWVGATYGGMDLPTEYPPVPAHLHYDLWLGPVEYRPYSPEWVPFKWRNWWAFGGGSLADFGCHFMDLPHWALDLRHPLRAEVVDGPTVHPDSTPPWLIVRYGYPARDEKPPVQLTWYHGGKKPDHLLEGQTDFTWNSGVMFIGDQGQLISDYGRHVLLPEEKYKDFQRPTPFIADSIGHHAEWILACKTGQPTTCSFDYSGPLTEAALLGNVAYRTGCAIEWDSARLRATNCSQAAEFVQHRYRKGWKL
ncbi:MAG: Gfo/Idh/MocA family protein [Rhodothermales bacterium]|jgi:predicted dehydrogenase